MPTQLKEVTPYVLLYTALVDCLIALVVAYEIILNTGDSREQTIINIAYGVSAAVAVTIVVFANVEVVRLLARMYERKWREQAKEEERKRRQEAYERFGVYVNGVLCLPNTPEVEAFLEGRDEQAA